MKRFANLWRALDTTPSQRAKVAALTHYFRHAPPEDAIWAIHLLRGQKFRRIITPELLRDWALELVDIPDWLFEESCNTVGDLTETATLILPPVEQAADIPLHVRMEHTLLPLGKKDENDQKTEILAVWKQMDQEQRLVFNLLLTGRFRMTLSERSLVKALSRYSGIAETVLTYRLTQPWEPAPEAFQRLLAADMSDAQMSQPYPFHLASLFKGKIEEMGNRDEWHLEWKWEGVRAQLIKREETLFIWSREHALITDKFPELQEIAANVPDGTVMDGMLVAWGDEKPLQVAELHRRMRRKNLTKALLQEIPVRFIVFDLLEQQGQDIRTRELSWRKRHLHTLMTALTGTRIQCSPEVMASDWDEVACIRAKAREKGAGGLMLKRLASRYHAGRNQKDWWKWLPVPFCVNAVLIYAQRIQGLPGAPGMEFTFAVWAHDRLVPFAKASDGLTEGEVLELDEFIRQNTRDRFGPVRSVKPELVFEIAFDGIQTSSRHKSGVIVRAPRIIRWRREKKAEEADTLETIRTFIC